MLIVQNANGKRFAVVVIKPGDRYGRDFVLTNVKDNLSSGETMVEFWDLDHQHGPVRPGSPVLGQFTGARYNLSTLLEDGGQRGVGIRLWSDIPEWTVDGEAMREVCGWLLGVQARRDVSVRV